ncbi:MAG: hypothetical protein PHF37_10485 [Phycisphaerae bacterium]|nr:hypothetical protein [Phycisphaerae bacterium]
MKNVLNAILVIVLTSGAVFAAGPINPNVSGSRIPTNVPPSKYQNSLIKSPNPIDASKNLVITGNVGQGKSFRGVVPYRATTAFGGNTGTSSLDSFIRDSTGAGDISGFRSSPQPYYSPTSTVTKFVPGTGQVMRPPTAGVYSAYERPLEMPQPFKYTPTQPVSYRPLSESLPQTLEQRTGELSQRQIELYGLSQKNEQQLSKFEHDLDIVSRKAKELQEKMGDQDTEAKPLTPQRAPFEIPETVLPPQAEPKQKLDVFDEVLERLKEFQPPKAAPQQEDEDTETEEEPEATQQDMINTAAAAKAFLGEHKTFAGFSKNRFNELMRSAERLLKERKFYRAADAYTLAAMYKKDDPLPLAGKCHALFAAGEYMSSVLFLSRAINMFPRYALMDVDMTAMIDRDTLENRVADVKEWIKVSDSWELHFLLAYIYHQMDRPQFAKEQIDIAYEKNPYDSAVGTLKTVIDQFAE